MKDFFFLFNFITSLKANKKHTNIKVQRREAIRADKEGNASPVAAINKKFLVKSSKV